MTLARARVLAAVLLLAARGGVAQVVIPTPAAVENGVALIPLPRNFTITQEVQAVTQANPDTSNPFAYWKQIDILPFLHYDGIRRATLSTSLSYGQYFAVPATSQYEHPEWRFTLMGR